MVETALFEARSIVLEIPDRHVAGLRAVVTCRHGPISGASARQAGTRTVVTCRHGLIGGASARQAGTRAVVTCRHRPISGASARPAGVRAAVTCRHGLLGGASARQAGTRAVVTCRHGPISGASARQAGVTVHDRDDDVRKRRPRVIEVVLRWPCRMIRMRMVEAEELGAELAGAPLGQTVVR